MDDKRDFLMETTVDLEAISAQLLLMYEGFEEGGFSATPQEQAKAINGIRRFLDRIIADVEAVDMTHDLVARKKATA